jgi:hypothetical protein
MSRGSKRLSKDKSVILKPAGLLSSVLRDELSATPTAYDQNLSVEEDNNKFLGKVKES